MDYLVSPDDATTPLFRATSGYISGFVACCSACSIHNLRASYMGEAIRQYKEPAYVLKYKEIKTLEEYYDYYGTGGPYAVTEEISYLFFLERLLKKIRDGAIGEADNKEYPFYGSTTWAPKTVFIADRMTGRANPKDDISCCKFMRYMRQAERAQDYGRMAVSNLADGAHGGQCAGGAWAPNIQYIEEAIKDAVKKLNDHANRLYKDHGKLGEKTAMGW